MDYRDYLSEQLQDPEFRREWDALEVDYQIRCAIIEERKRQGLTQTQLAKAAGMDQRVLSRVETGDTVPTVRTLDKIAKGFGKRLVISFEDPVSAQV